MRRSNIILLIAAFMMSLSILTYDFSLRDSFRSGRYKDPFNSFNRLSTPRFDRANVISSTTCNVKFIQGPFAVRVEKAAGAYTRVSVVDSELIIEAHYDHRYLFNPEEFVVIVSCPRLSSVRTDARYFNGVQLVTDTVYRSDWQMRAVLIQGFRQDSMRLEQDYGSTIRLDNDSLKYLSLLAGRSSGSGSRTVLESGIHIGRAEMDIRHRSELLIGSADIGDLSYRFDDSATLSITGKSRHFFTSAKSWQP